MAEKKPNAFVRSSRGAAKFFRDYKNKLKKVVWPVLKLVSKNTGMALAMILIIGLLIPSLGIVFMNLLELFTNIAK